MARLVQRFNEQLKSLRQQITAMIVANCVPRRQPPNPRQVGEDGDDYVGDENDYLLAADMPRRGGPKVQAKSALWDVGFKLDIPEFNDCMQPEEFVDWVAIVEETMEFKGDALKDRVPLVVTKLVTTVEEATIEWPFT